MIAVRKAMQKYISNRDVDKWDKPCMDCLVQRLRYSNIQYVYIIFMHKNFNF